MGVNLKKTFIVDIEATCWDTENGEEAQGPNEVIEIGIVEMNLSTLEISNKRSYPVKPRFSTISPFCTSLTGWTQNQIENAPDIVDVLKAIRHDYRISKNHTWWSCGEYDRYKLSSDPTMGGSLGALYEDIRNAYANGDDLSPFSTMRIHYNIKSLLAMSKGWTREAGMAAMLNTLKIPLDGRHHNGADDAYNTAKLVKHFLQKHRS